MKCLSVCLLILRRSFSYHYLRSSLYIIFLFTESLLFTDVGFFTLQRDECPCTGCPPFDVPIRRTEHYAHVCLANDINGSGFGHQTFPRLLWGSNPVPLAPEASEASELTTICLMFVSNNWNYLYHTCCTDLPQDCQFMRTTDLNKLIGSQG